MKQTLVIALLLLFCIGGFIFNRSRDDSEANSRSRDQVETIRLKGATQFGEEHAFTRTIRKFEQLVVEYYSGPLDFELYLNRELGLEKDYFAYMSQGISVDYGIVSPAHMSTFSKSAPLMDVPFLYRDIEHWNKVLESDAFDPIGQEITDNADVMLIGYAGGGIRNLIAKQPVTNMDQLKGLTIRVMGAPIQTQMFQAIGASPTVISYDEVYNAMQTGVIDAAENEAAGMQQMKFYEVGPEICLTQHAITVRPLCFGGKTFRRLPAELQQAILRAGREAGAYGRQLESTEDAAILARMKQEGKLRTHKFAARAELLRLAEPIKQAYAREINATEVLARIADIQ
jgi:tripartite ATP-independent transporter DctP family solute receptor